MSARLQEQVEVEGAAVVAPDPPVRVAATDRRWYAFAASVALVLALYWPTVWSIASRWWDSPTYSSGLLIGPLSAWLTWRVARSGRIDDAPPAPWVAALVLLAGLGWLVARAGTIEVVQQLAIPALLLGSGWALFGRRGLAALLIPIGVLYFVIPAWDYFMPILQAQTVDVVGAWLDALRVPAYIEGNRVILPRGGFQIVEGCSGLHFFMTAGALAAIYCHLYLRRAWAMVALFAAAVGLALVANWIRVATVIVAGHLTDMQHFLVTKDHYYFGWAVFVVMMLPAYLLGRRLEAVPARAAGGRAAPAAESARPGRARAAVVATLCAVAAGPVLWLAATAGTGGPVGSLAFPRHVGDWRSTGPAATDWAPVQPGAAVADGRAYMAGDMIVDMQVAYYPAQRDGREVIGYGNRLARAGDGDLRLFPGEPGWARLESAGRATRVIRYAYVVGGRETSSRGGAKLLQVAGTLGRRPEAMLVALSARCTSDCEDARQAVTRLEQALINKHGGLGRGISPVGAPANQGVGP